MSKLNIGILHPGEMGISLAVSAQHSSQQIYWCPEGRSQATKQRAQQHNLLESQSLNELCQVCHIIICVCPPHSAREQALAVINSGFQGIYVDVNAISPQSVKLIAKDMEATGISFVDGGIIGLPAWKANTTWLYLAGNDAQKVSNCFAHGPLETKILGSEIGQASALKMCFAANSKGAIAMLTAILSAAEQYGVRDALEQQWDIDNSAQSAQQKSKIESVARKAWRFEGEMQEIAATLQAVGMPEGFHLAAADIFGRQAKFKESGSSANLESIIESCIKQQETINKKT